MSDFAASVTRGHRHTRVEEAVPSQVSGETFIPGDFVVWDDSNNWVERAAADPTAIVAISEVNSERARVLTPDGKVPLRAFQSDAVLAMCSATQYVEATHRMQSYGITRLASGNWAVDVAKTGGDARVLVIDGDLGQNIWYVQVLSANIALDGIAS